MSIMTSNNPDREPNEAEVSEPLLVSEVETDADADAVLDAEELRARIATSNAARRWTRIRITIGAITALLIFAIFIRLSRYRRPFDFVTHKSPHFFPEYESQRVQIRYGPLKIPGSGQDNGMKNFKIQGARAPCEDCLIVWMQAGLEYLNGIDASVEEGMWLHHTVLHNEVRTALHNCDKGNRRQRFFASGNERTAVDLSSNGTEKRGYWFGRNDAISMTTELMNENKTEQTVALTITYEYIPYMSQDFSIVTPIWLDIGGCQSEVHIPPTRFSYEYEGPIWNSSINGRVATVVSHLHDGGIKIRVQRDREDVCVSEAEYGRVSSSGSHKHSTEMSHITNMSECHDVGRMTVGEEWAVKAQYDTEKHEPMHDGNGNPEPIMGIAMVYVVED